MIQHGGEWQKKDGTGKAGNGLHFHYKELIKIIWPHFKQHRWFDLILQEWLTHTFVGIIGPKDSGKSGSMAIIHLADYYCFPHSTLCMFSSTTKESLENRVWGEVKIRHREAKSNLSWLPGNLIEGRQRIVTDDRDELLEGRDFRRGMTAIPLKKGTATVGMDSIIGIKQKRKRWFIDELQTTTIAAIDATANFIQNGADCKVSAAGNPDNITSTLGRFCEPAPELGGWDSGIDQTPKTKKWKTKFDKGICIQLPGSDSPNMDVPPEDPVPFPFLMTRARMESDAKTWGKEDWHYFMFNEGRFPRGQGSRRVITRQLCLTHHALESPLWKNNNRVRIEALDAAYRSVGGDRCALLSLEFGEEAITDDKVIDVSNLIQQSTDMPKRRQIIALVGVQVIPIKSSDFESPEDQIVMFVKRHCEARGVPPRNFFYDSGMRTSLVSAFSRLWSPDTNPIDCGGRPSERTISEGIDVMACDHYSKKITELWWSVRYIIEGAQFRGLTDEVMMEGCEREWKMVGANKIEVESKSDMKEKCGYSPDLFDCLALGVEGARQRGFLIRRITNPDAVEVDERWKSELRQKARSVYKQSQLNYAT